MTSLFERLGGQPAITKAVDVFYRKMLKDPRVARFFATTDMNRQRAKQAAFLTMVTGGPAAYTGKDMRTGHAHLVAQGLNDSHVDVVIEHLGATLAELGAKSEDIAQVAALANSVRDDVLNRASPSGAGR
ncbi:MAG: group 1 truncated hemoglobin [Planctomycetes bacterium]|nr:group 1 truncated hemoglobin [Planctomycetota bacterium]